MDNISSQFSHNFMEFFFCHKSLMMNTWAKLELALTHLIVTKMWWKCVEWYLVLISSPSVGFQNKYNDINHCQTLINKNALTNSIIDRLEHISKIDLFNFNIH